MRRLKHKISKRLARKFKLISLYSNIFKPYLHQEIFNNLTLLDFAQQQLDLFQGKDSIPDFTYNEILQMLIPSNKFKFDKILKQNLYQEEFIKNKLNYLQDHLFVKLQQIQALPANTISQLKLQAIISNLKSIICKQLIAYNTNTEYLKLYTVQPFYNSHHFFLQKHLENYHIKVDYKYLKEFRLDQGRPNQLYCQWLEKELDQHDTLGLLTKDYLIKDPERLLKICQNFIYHREPDSKKLDSN